MALDQYHKRNMHMNWPRGTNDVEQELAQSLLETMIHRDELQSHLGAEKKIAKRRLIVFTSGFSAISFALGSLATHLFSGF